MTERPILFNAEMVRAILDGRKTVTRRDVKPAKCQDSGADLAACEVAGEVNGKGDVRLCPYGKPGDRLWVREAWTTRQGLDGVAPRDISRDQSIGYIADTEEAPWLGKVRPSIHMPRWASRILLEVTDVRVERLQEISADDAVAEGVDAGICRRFVETSPSRHTLLPTEIHGFAGLWSSTGGDWDANPWVWVIEFKRIDQ